MLPILKKLAIFLPALCILSLIGISSFAQESNQPNIQQETKSDSSLYARLGGVRNIATVVDDFVDRIWENPVLNQNPKNKKAMGTSKAGLKFLVTELVCQVTGGPQKYTGRGIKEVHANLNISEKEWNAMAADFKATLDKFNVPAKEQQELFTIVGSTHDDIVTKKN